MLRFVLLTYLEFTVYLMQKVYSFMKSIKSLDVILEITSSTKGDSKNVAPI